MIVRLWLLVLLVCVSAFAPSRADARAAENRTWVFLPTTTETRLETESQVAGTHQENRVWGYEHAPGRTQAAESITNTKVLQFADGAWFDDVAAYRALKADISRNGLTNKLIEYTEIDGSKYVLRGNGRLQVAEDLKITDQLQFKKVDLPFQGYRTLSDVLEEANRIIYNKPRGP